MIISAVDFFSCVLRCPLEIAHKFATQLKIADLGRNYSSNCYSVPLIIAVLKHENYDLTNN